MKPLSLAKEDRNVLRQIFTLTRVSYRRMAGSVLFAAAATCFEGLSYLLLVPTIHALITMDVEFIRSAKHLEAFLTLLPKSWLNTDACLLMLLIGSVFVSQCLKNLAQILFNRNVMIQNRQFTTGLRAVIFEKYLALGKSFFDQRSPGILQQILMSHPKVIAQSLKTVQHAFYTLLLLLLSLAIMAKISWFLTAVVICAAPLLNLSVNVLIQKIRQISSQSAKANTDLARRAGTTLSGMTLIKACSAEGLERARLAGPSLIADQKMAAVDWKQFLIGPIQEMLGLVLIFSLLMLAAYRLVGENSGYAAAYLVFFIILRRLMPMLGLFSRLNASLAALHGPLQDIRGVLFETDEHIIAEGKQPFQGLKTAIQFKDLSFKYPKGSREVLKKVNFEMPRGTVTALVGPSGAGKTTLAHLLMRFYNISEGSILLDGVDLCRFSLRSYHQKVAFISQECPLFDESIRYNLNYGCEREFSDEELRAVLRKARLGPFIDKLPKGLETAVGDRGMRLSGGERQRLAIARAFLRKAEILILDEATNALDGETEKLIQEAIAEVTKDKTTLVVAHRFSTIRGADRIVVLERGSVAEEGPLQKLLENKGLFWKLWEAQRFY